MKRILLFIAMVLTFVFGVSASASETIDYGDENAFEEALNRGDFLEGKIVRFTVKEIHPNSTLGFNLWSGEHLNFVSSRNPDVNVGDVLVVKTDTISNTLGSWVITYEILDDVIESEETIVSDLDSQTDASSVTPTPPLITPVVTADGADAANAVPISISSIEKVTLIGEYAFPGVYGDQFRYVLFFRNDTGEDVEFEVKATARDAAGNIIGVSHPVHVFISSGCENSAICYFGDLNYYDVVGINYEMTEVEYKSSRKYYEDCLAIEYNDYGDKVLVTVTNNGTEKIDEIYVSVFYFSGEKMVHYEDQYSLSGADPGIPMNLEFSTLYKDVDYDSVKVFAEGSKN